MSDLVADNIAKEYPTRSEPLVVLRDVSCRLSDGDSLAILGPSGSGKSTLLHILGTLDRPTSGQVTLRGQDPFSLAEPQLAEFRNKNVGFVFQDHHLLPQLSVLENVLVPTLAEGGSDPSSIEHAHELIERVGLTARTEHRPAELSGGEKQRVAVARAMIRRPVLLLADEPTGSLDRTNAERIGQLLIDLQADVNMILVVVTHSFELAERFAQKIQLDDGRLCERSI